MIKFIVVLVVKKGTAVQRVLGQAEDLHVLKVLYDVLNLISIAADVLVFRQFFIRVRRDHGHLLGNGGVRAITFTIWYFDWELKLFFSLWICILLGLMPWILLWWYLLNLIGICQNIAVPRKFPDQNLKALDVLDIGALSWEHGHKHLGDI